MPPPKGSLPKYTYCVAENIAASPWESYPRSRGIAAPQAVTLHAGENPHNFHDMESDSPEPILGKAASVMATLGCNNAPIGQGEFFHRALALNTPPLSPMPAGADRMCRCSFMSQPDGR